MRLYQDEKKELLQSIVCNMCQKNLKVEKGIVQEGYFTGKELFGYFSNKDGEMHEFDLCEACYDKLIESFQIEVEKKEVSELL